MKNRFTLLLAFCLTASTAFAQLVDVVTGLTFPYGLALDGNDLYFSNGFFNKISKIDVSLANPPIVDVVVVERAGELLLIGDELYFCDLEGNRISKINITESNPTPTVVVTGNLETPSGLLLNGNILYITDGGTSKLYSADISQPNPTLVELLSGFFDPTDMVYKDSVLYISEFAGNRVSKVDLNQSPLVRTNFAWDITKPVGMTLNGDFLYVASQSTLYKIDINQPFPSTIVASGLQSSRMVASNGIDMYIAQVGNVGQGQGKISKLKIDLSAVIDISQTNIEIFPNPTEGDIQLRNVSAEMVEVFDNMGRLVLSEMNPGSNVDISQAAAGVYFLKIYADGQVYSTQVVKR